MANILPEKLPEELNQLLGFHSCPLTYWSLGSYALLLVLFVSTFVRYRGIIFYRYYAKRNTAPRRFCTVTAIPYEALLVFLLLGVPRMVWARYFVEDAIKADAWESRNLSSPWAWIFVGYFFMLDIYERVSFRRNVLKPYFQMKEKRAQDVLDSIIQEKPLTGGPADEESAIHSPAAAEPAENAPRTLKGRLLRLIKIKFTYPEPSAVNILAQYHVFAFTKATFVFVFLSDVALMACNSSERQKHLFDMTSGFSVQFMIVGFWMSVRFIGLLVRGASFGRREINFAALNGREGQLRL